MKLFLSGGLGFWLACSFRPEGEEIYRSKENDNVRDEEQIEKGLAETERRLAGSRVWAKEDA